MLKTKQLSRDAMLSALCAVLGYISLDLGNLKVTFESLPILLAALLFGPVDGLLVGAVGTLIYQILRYGFTATTVLWMLPYMLAGAAAGWYAKKKDFRQTPRQTLVLVILLELMITVLNTGALYIDSHIYGYYSPAFIFGSLGIRLVICVAKAAVFGLLLPQLVRVLNRTGVQTGA